MTKKSLFLFLLVSLSTLSFNWLDDFSEVIIQKLTKFTTSFPQEKAYLQTDKPYYMPGDTLFFRAWLAEAGSHQVDTASLLLYVDLVDVATKKVVALRRVSMSAGTGHGDIALPDALKGGTYTLRAYTSWMRNFSDDFFFHKDLSILDPTGSAEPTATRSDAIDIQFFPEGGHLVEGIDGKIAFKAINSSGLGCNIEGVVVNKNNDTLSGFQSYHLGMGSFPLKPMAGDSYRVLIRQKDSGKPYTDYQLPKIQPLGYSLRIDNLTNRNLIKVFVSNNLPASATGELTLLAHNRGTVVFSAKAKLEKKTIAVSIPKIEIPEGITHFTLFNEKNKAVCERLIFLDHYNRLSISVKPTKTSYQPREKTELEVMVTDTAGNPVETNLALSAVDAKQILDQPFTSNIVSYLLLTSDLKGNIEQPAGYFDRNNKFASIQLDLLMVTQGWNRFSWKEVIDESRPTPSFFVEQGVSILGQVLKGNKKSPGKVGLTVMLTTDSTRMFVSTQATEAGKFEIHNLDLRDSTGILVQAAKQKSGGGSGSSTNLLVSLLPFLEPAVTTQRIPFKTLNPSSKELEEYLRRNQEYLDIERKIRANREKLLKEVVVKGKKDILQRDTRKIYSRADATLKPNATNLGGAMTIFDFIQGRVAGVIVSGSGMNATVQIRGSSNFQGVVEPLFILDGAPTTKDAMYNLPVTDVESIDVLKGPSAAIYGSRGGGGVIAVYTKRGNSDYDWSKEEVEGIAIQKIPGYNVEKEFYSPKYDVNRPEHNRPDYRSTIFWAPMVKTDKSGKATVNFYNTDAKTTVSVRVEGLTWSGQPGSTTLNYEVR